MLKIANFSQYITKSLSSQNKHVFFLLLYNLYQHPKFNCLIIINVITSYPPFENFEDQYSLEEEANTDVINLKLELKTILSHS